MSYQLQFSLLSNNFTSFTVTCSSRINIRTEEAGLIRSLFRRSSRKLFILDYDGTLVPYRCDPARALPDKALLGLLGKISTIPGADLAISSGRDKSFLESIFDGLKAHIFAEYGASYRNNGTWHTSQPDYSWQPDIEALIRSETASVAGSYIERKENSLVWHYRGSDPSVSEYTALVLTQKLADPCNKYGLSIVNGRKIVEVKTSGHTKGSAITKHIDCSIYDFILAAGDDIPDDELFRSLPDSALRIHVGKNSQFSNYHVRNSFEFVGLLEYIIS